MLLYGAVAQDHNNDHMEPHIHSKDDDFYDVRRNFGNGYVYMNPRKHEPNEPFEFTCIFFHGYTSAEDNYDLFKDGEFGETTRFVFPQAENLKLDGDASEMQYSWY